MTRLTYTKAKTEPEAIFKACEYIYANLLKDKR